MSLAKLNVGCGRNRIDGWLHLDAAALPGIDIVADLETCATAPLPLADGSVDEFLLSHVMEHIRNVLPMMQELYRIAAPDARMVVRVPYGSSDDAYEDPTHVRQLFLNSFGYFSQPNYWRADYGYRGDWLTESITLVIAPDIPALPDAQLLERVHRDRNVVVEMVAILRAVKPMREAKRELQNLPSLHLHRPAR
jgi:SAM-dependent methyltransferase